LATKYENRPANRDRKDGKGNEVYQVCFPRFSPVDVLDNIFDISGIPLGFSPYRLRGKEA
jgi:hypothetical protein